jgi:hypothetical protein
MERRVETLRNRARVFRSAALALSLLVFFFSLCAPEICRGEAAILRVMYRNASDVLPLVEGLLSREGRAAVDTQSNSLVVVDSPDSIRRIEAFLSDLDRPVRQARVRLKFKESESTQGSSLSVGGGASGENWKVTTGRPPSQGVGVRVGNRETDQRERSEYAIQVGSGSPAYIAVGKEVPYTRRWVDLCRNHGRPFETVSIQRIETGMEVRAVLMGDRADVEIMPRISHEAGGGLKEVIRFAGASSRVTIPLGQWVELGAVQGEGSEAMKAILETGSASRQHALSMVIMVEEVQ